MENFFWGGQWWNGSDKAAFAQWLQRHGASYNVWARNHPAVAQRVFGSASGNASGTMAEDLMGQASSQADAAIKANIDAINAERAKSDASSQALMQNAQGIYSALAGMLKDVGPNTANIYQNATSEQSAIAKGFADAQGAIQSGEAKTAGDFLNKIGAPKEQIAQVLDKVGGTGATDVLYGLGGAIPATALNREGAAFSAAAARLPAEATGIGMQNIQQLASEALKNNQDFSNQIDQVYGGRSSMIQDILAKLQDNARADRAEKLQEAYYGRSLANDQYGRQQDAQARADKQAAIAADTRASNAKARAAAASDRENAFAAARQSIFSDVKSLVKPMSLDEQVAWVAAHPGKTIADAPKAKKPTYAQASKALFDQYKDLLRYATAAGRPALKRRLNQMIREALASVGITPAAPASKKSSSSITVPLPLGGGWTLQP